MMSTMMQYPWTLVFMIGVQLDTENGGMLGVFEMEWIGQKFHLLDYCHIATKYYIHFHQIKIWKVHTTNEHGGILAFDGARKYPLYFQLLLFKIM